MYEKLKEILVTKLNVAPEKVTPEVTWDDLELDSLAVVELSLVLETELDVQVSEDELFEIQTVGALVDLIETKITRV
jgi:acyl carrier protein